MVPRRMPRKVVVYRERRSATALATPDERRQHCWQVANCPETQRQGCYAFYSGQDCWDLWALRPLQRKRCCRKRADCRECSIWQTKFPEVLALHAPARNGEGLTSSGPAGKVCPHLASACGGALPGDRHALLARAESGGLSALRCNLRGAYLAEDYVIDVCASRQYRDCIFLEE
jgi:hypothetical protein